MTTTKNVPRRPGRPVDPARQRKRRREILETAGRLFAGRGYSKTDVAEIATALGLTKASIYHYYESKEALFFAAVDAKFERLSEQMSALAERVGSDVSGIASACETYLRFFAENPDAVELMIQERSMFKDRETPTYFLYRDATLRHWTVVFEELIGRGAFRAVAPVATLRLVSDLLYGRVISNFFVGDTRDAREQTKEVMDLVLLGLLPRQDSDGDNEILGTALRG